MTPLLLEATYRPALPVDLPLTLWPLRRGLGRPDLPGRARRRLVAGDVDAGRAGDAAHRPGRRAAAPGLGAGRGPGSRGRAGPARAPRPGGGLRARRARGTAAPDAARAAADAHPLGPRSPRAHRARAAGLHRRRACRVEAHGPGVGRGSPGPGRAPAPAASRPPGRDADPGVPPHRGRGLAGEHHPPGGGAGERAGARGRDRAARDGPCAGHHPGRRAVDGGPRGRTGVRRSRCRAGGRLQAPAPRHLGVPPRAARRRRSHARASRPVRRPPRARASPAGRGPFVAPAPRAAHGAARHPRAGRSG